jgi:hypothetical protein
MLKSARMSILGLGLGLASGMIAPVFAEEDSGSRVPSSVLSLEEYSRATQIAAPQATSRAFNLDPSAARSSDEPNREVVTNVQAVGVGKSSSRLAIVTLYRYDGNVSINRLIDIDSGRVIREERMQNAVAPMGDVEIEYANLLLQKNQQAREILASLGDGAAVSFRLQTVTDRRNPLFGKRIMAAAFHTPDGYVGGLPNIQVNLTDGTVTVAQ